MKVCYVCFTAYESDHECEVAKKLAEKPIELTATFVHGEAVPTRDTRYSK